MRSRIFVSKTSRRESPVNSPNQVVTHAARAKGPGQVVRRAHPQLPRFASNGGSGNVRVSDNYEASCPNLEPRAHARLIGLTARCDRRAKRLNGTLD